MIEISKELKEAAIALSQKMSVDVLRQEISDFPSFFITRDSQLSDLEIHLDQFKEGGMIFFICQKL